MKCIHQNHQKAGLALLVFVMLSAANLSAEVDTMDVEVTGYEFLLGSNPGTPIVGVQSANRVVVKRPDNSRKVVSPDPHQLHIVERKMKPVGRITICRSEARSERESRVNNDIVAQMTGSDVQFEMGETSFKFELVADRDLNGVYVALFLYHPDHPTDQTVDFGNIGDLRAGEFVKREITFPNTTVSEGMEYRFEFFSNGSPLEMFMLPNVAMNPASRSLQIPWSVRLNCYLTHGKEARRNAHPRPWRMGFDAIDLEDYKDRGATDMKIKIRVLADGSAVLVEGDQRMTQSELTDLRKDVAQWKFFPELNKGKPEDKLVAAPLKL